MLKFNNVQEIKEFEETQFKNGYHSPEYWDAKEYLKCVTDKIRIKNDDVYEQMFNNYQITYFDNEIKENEKEKQQDPNKYINKDTVEWDKLDATLKVVIKTESMKRIDSYFDEYKLFNNIDLFVERMMPTLCMIITNTTKNIYGSLKTSGDEKIELFINGNKYMYTDCQYFSMDNVLKVLYNSISTYDDIKDKYAGNETQFASYFYNKLQGEKSNAIKHAKKGRFTTRNKNKEQEFIKMEMISMGDIKIIDINANKQLISDGGFNLNLEIKEFMDEYLPNKKGLINIDRIIFSYIVGETSLENKYSDKTIGFILGITIAAVKSRKLRLRKLFKEYHNCTLNKKANT